MFMYADPRCMRCLSSAGNTVPFDVKVVVYFIVGIGYFGPDLGHDLFEIVGIEQYGWRGVRQDADQFAPVETPVEGGVDGAQLAAGIDQVQVLDAVAGQDGHPVAVAHAGHIAQPVGQPVDAPVPFLIGQTQLGLLAGVNDGQFVGAIDLAPP